MEELIKVREENGKRLVSARELYNFLGATERFENWFNRQLQFGFTENEEFTTVKSFTLVNNGASREIMNYALSLDMAKEISMIQRSDKGKEARQYFILCEKNLKKIVQTPKTYLEALKLLVKSEEEKEQLLLVAKNATDKVNLLIHNNKPYTTSEISKELNLKSAQILNNILSEKGIQYKQNGTWLLYSKYSNQGYVSIKQSILDSGRIIYDRQWTGKGREFILSLLK